jgi:hypothetical protein
MLARKEKLCAAIPMDPTPQCLQDPLWHIAIALCLGTLIGVYSAWVLVDLLLGMDRDIKHDAGMRLGAMMLSLIFQFCSRNKHRQVTLFGSLVETNKFAPLSVSAHKEGIIDPEEMQCAGDAVCW